MNMPVSGNGITILRITVLLDPKVTVSGVNGEFFSDHSDTDAVASCLNYSPYLNAPFLITAYSIISILSFEKCAKKGKHSANYSQSAFPSSFQLGCHIVVKGGDLFLFQSVGHINIDIHRRRYISVSQDALNEFEVCSRLT